MSLTGHAIAHLLLAASSSKSKSGGSSSIIFVLLIAFVGIYFLWLRPQRNRLRQQQAQTREAAVGDEVVTTSGIVGRVLSFDADRVTIETGHGHTMTLMRSAIARRIPPEGEVPLTDLDEGEDLDGTGAAPEAGAGGEAHGEGGSPEQTWWPGKEEPPGESGQGVS